MKRALLYAFAVAAVGAVGVVAWLALDPGDAPPAIDTGPERGEIPDEPVPEGKVRIAGTVSDELGKPVPGAFVYLLAPGDPIVPTVGPLNVRSDGDGAFTLVRDEELDGDRALDLIATSPGFVPTLVENASGDGLQVVLKRGGVIRGVVLDDNDRPVAGAKVVAITSGSAVRPPRGIYLPHHETLSVTYARTLSGIGGAFVIRGVGDGPVDLVAEKRTHPELLRPVTGAVAGEENARLVLLRAFRVSIGVVSAETNEPLVSANVVLTMPGENGGKEQEIRGSTDRSGEMSKKLDFPAARAPDVRVTVRAGTEDHGSVMAEGVPLAELAEGEGFTLRLAKQVPGALKLTVLYDNGKPYRNWIYFEVEPSFGDKFHRWSRIDQEGMARIELPPGHYKALRPQTQGPIESVPIENLTLLAGEEVEKAITVTRGGDLRLTLTLPEGEEARGAKVNLEYAGGKTNRAMWGKVFWLADVPEGTATLTVTLEGYLPVRREVAIVKDERRDEKITLVKIPGK